jgi:hypothetical protein
MVQLSIAFFTPSEETVLYRHRIRPAEFKVA